MSKIKNVIASLGTAAGMGIAILPLATYAETTTSANPNTVTANISATISMELVSSQSAGSTEAEKTLACNSYDKTEQSDGCTGADQVARTTLLPGEADLTTMYTDVYVSTNNVAGYDLTLVDSDNNNNLQTLAGDTIAPISSEPAGTTNPGWAIRIDGANTWYAMPAKNSGNTITVKSYTDQTTIANRDHSKVYYGVAATSTQATGVYQDTVVYTATTR